MKGLICFLCSALFCVQIYASDGYIEAARKLEEKGDYALAATLLTIIHPMKSFLPLPV